MRGILPEMPLMVRKKTHNDQLPPKECKKRGKKGKLRGEGSTKI